METKLYKLVYCSRNRIEGTPDQVREELDGILAASRANNAKVGVSGALIYSAGSFAQVLEGPVEPVCAIFERIQRDFRHSEVTVLYSGPSDGRRFPDWSMAFAGSDSKRGIADTESAFEAAFAHADQASERIMGILQQIVTQENDWMLEYAA